MTKVQTMIKEKNIYIFSTYIHTNLTNSKKMEKRDNKLLDKKSSIITNIIIIINMRKRERER